MGNTRGLTDKPITKETVLDPVTGKVVARHETTVVTDPTAANAVQIPDADQYPSANQTHADPLEVHTAPSPADALDADSADVNELQTLAKTGTVSGGTYTLSWNGDTTTALPVAATAADVKAALVAMSPELDADDLTVTGGPVSSTPVAITFKGDYAAQDVPAITVDGALATGGGTLAVTETTKGVKADK